MDISSAIVQGIQRDVRPWLNLAEDLHQLSMDQELSVPQIVVMGDQSSGKSSVLEALSGIPFPRGSGLVTRCPIRLVMRNAKKGESWSAIVSSTVQGTDSVRVSSASALSSIMEQFTNQLTKNKNGFSRENIIVQLVSPDAPDLTVVDLPGIIRTTTVGQDSDVIDEVNTMIEQFLVEQRTIILAVIPSNQDIATVDILERAQRVDPMGERTVGVLTKPDLIGPGNESEVLAVLHNVRKVLRLGYVMVKNRSQKELQQGMTTQQARALEEDFFKNHPHFKNCDPSLFGIHNLTNKLTNVLVTRIQQELVPMKNQVEMLLAEVRRELRQFEKYGTADTIPEKQRLLVTLTQELVRFLNDCVRGEYRNKTLVVRSELRLYTRILVLFDNFQEKVIKTAPPFKQENFAQQLAHQMEQFRGRELPGFMSAQAFFMFMSQYSEAWRAPARWVASEVRNASLEVAMELCEVVAIQYPQLKENFRTIVARVLENCLDNACRSVDELLSREKDPFTINDALQAQINKIRQERFLKAVDEAFRASRINADSWSTSKDEICQNMRKWYRQVHSVNSTANAEEMSAILEAYWTLAAKRFIDNVCIALDHSILGQLPVQVQEECYKFVHDESILSTIFEEDAQLVAKKQQLIDKRDRLSKANSLMANIQVRRPGYVQSNVTVSINQHGLGLNLGENGGKIIVKGFRDMPPGVRNPSQDAGIRVGDTLEQLDGQNLGSFSNAIKMLKGRTGTITLTITRQK